MTHSPKNRNGKSLLSFCVLLFCFIAVLPVYGDHADTKLKIRFEDIENGEIIKLPSLWRFHDGDNPEWALPDYNDQNWIVRKSYLPKTHFGDEYSSGVGWFRQTIEIDSSLIGKSLELQLFHCGAAELYINGEMLVSFGEFGTDKHNEIIEYDPSSFPVRFTFVDTTEQVIALKYSNWSAIDVKGTSFKSYFFVSISNQRVLTTSVARDREIWRMIQALSVGMAFTFTIIHFLLFLFDPRKKENLYFTIFTLCAAYISATPIQWNFENSWDTVVLTVQLFKIVLLLLSYSFAMFLGNNYFGKNPKYSRLILAVFSLYAIVSLFIALEITYLASSLLLLYGLYIHMDALKKKLPGARLMTLGIFMFAAGSIISMLQASQLISISDIVPMFAHVIGLLGLLDCMSISHAKKVTSTSKSLEQKIKDVEELSELRIEQERQLSDKEMERLALEAENEMKARELEESRRREGIMNELELAYKELKQTQVQLIQSEKSAAVGNLVAGVAHELNSPIGAIKSSVDVITRCIAKIHALVKRAENLEDLKGDSIFMRTMAILEENSKLSSKAGERINIAVKNLRQFVRLDESDYQKANLITGIENTLQVIRHLIGKKVEIVKEYSEIPLVYCSARQINQVFLQLFTNALSALDGSGRIIVRTRDLDDRVEVDIEDDGCGIDSSRLDNLFDIGFHADSERVKMGFGLSTCMQILHQHNGSISVKSDLNRGSVFVVSLPKKNIKVAESSESKSR